MPHNIPPAERLAFSIAEVGQLSSLSRRTIERAILSGELKSYRKGGRRLVLRADALRWLAKDQPIRCSGVPAVEEVRGGVEL